MTTEQPIVSTGKEWYKNVYLTSVHWQEVKEQVLENYFYICSMPGCGKTSNLEFHHLSYDRRGTVNEWRDIRILCHQHHYLAHIKFNWLKLRFERLPLTRRALSKRYMTLYHATWRRVRPSDIFNWIGQGIEWVKVSYAV